MKRLIIGALMGAAVSVGAREGFASLERDQEVRSLGFGGVAFQRWRDDETDVTCFAFRTSAGTALSCLPGSQTRRRP